MSVQGFNSAKCEQRNRVAASRFGVDAVPLRFRGSVASKIAGDGFNVLKSEGILPQTTAEALALINAKLPEGAVPLAESDVYLQFHEAANSNFVGCYYLYLDESTLRNIALGGAEGVSFMNAHRTGGLSTPSELPFGQTFSGVYEEGFDADGLAARRTILGVYLLRGVKPNGDGGPSTDDLDKGFRAGTVKDVSVGLSGGEAICDICGYGLNQTAQDEEGYTIYLCPHVPGTHRAMKPDEIEAQKQRDPRNSKGVATYSLADATLNELSAVYDGAVPGAGIRKVMGLSRHMGRDTGRDMGSDLTREELRQTLQEAYEFYGKLLPFDLGEVVEIKQAAPAVVAAGGKSMAQRKTAKSKTEETQSTEDETQSAEPEYGASDTPDEPEGAASAGAASADEDRPENATDQPAGEEDLAAKVRALETQLSKANKQLSGHQSTARQQAREKFAASLSGKVPPAAREALQQAFAAAQDGKTTTAHLEAFVAAAPRHSAFEEKAASSTLTEVQPPGTDDPYARDAESARTYAQKQNRKKKTSQ